MLSIYKIWTASSTQAQWTQKLEDYIMSKRPTNHKELESLVQEYFNNLK